MRGKGIVIMGINNEVRAGRIEQKIYTEVHVESSGFKLNRKN